MATLTATTTKTEDIGLSAIRLKNVRHFSKESPLSRSSDVNLPALTRNSSNGNRSNGADAPDSSATSQNRGEPGDDSSKVQRRKNIQFATLCFNLFLAGYQDG